MRIPPIMRFWRVNFKDWLWFVIILKGNEFSNKLSIRKDIFSSQLKGKSKLIRNRKRAHDIDMLLNK